MSQGEPAGSRFRAVLICRPAPMPSPSPPAAPHPPPALATCCPDFDFLRPPLPQQTPSQSKLAPRLEASLDPVPAGHLLWTSLTAP